MKSSLQRQLIYMSKLMLYGFVIQCLAYNFLLAHNGMTQDLGDVFLTVNLRNTSLEEAFSEIEKETDFKFLYSDGSIDLKRISNIGSYTEVSLKEILISIARKNDVRFKRINNTIIVDPLKKANRKLEVIVEVDEKIIVGTVTAENNEPLPGVNVLVKGTTIGVITDVEGKYKINVPDDATTLVFSYVGYLTEEVDIAGRTTVDLVLTPDIETLSEIVVVGYGTQRKSDLTGAVSSVSSEEIKNLPDPNVMNQIQGRVAGLTISNSDFRAGDGPNILIRGKNSITASNDPLIILDGLPYDGSIATINPNDIETINVLKDASSTAIYGSRGSNGVVLITTKLGSSGKPTINYSGSVGFNSILKKIDVLDADQYLELRTHAGTLHPSEQANYDNNRITDWQDLATRRAVQHNHSLGISGGGEKFKYWDLVI